MKRSEPIPPELLCPSCGGERVQFEISCSCERDGEMTTALCGECGYSWTLFTPDEALERPAGRR